MDRGGDQTGAASSRGSSVYAEPGTSRAQQWRRGAAGGIGGRGRQRGARTRARSRQRSSQRPSDGARRKLRSARRTGNHMRRASTCSSPLKAKTTKRMRVRRRLLPARALHLRAVSRCATHSARLHSSASVAALVAAANISPVIRCRESSRVISCRRDRFAANPILPWNTRMVLMMQVM